MAESLCPKHADNKFGPRVHVSCRSFDFTLLFEDTFFILLPAAVLLVLLPLRLYTLRKARVQVHSYRLALCKQVCRNRSYSLCLSLTRSQRIGTLCCAIRFARYLSRVPSEKPGAAQQPLGNLWRCSGHCCLGSCSLVISRRPTLNKTLGCSGSLLLGNNCAVHTNTTFILAYFGF